MTKTKTKSPIDEIIEHEGLALADPNSICEYDKYENHTQFQDSEDKWWETREYDENRNQTRYIDSKGNKFFREYNSDNEIVRELTCEFGKWKLNGQKLVKRMAA